MSKTGEWEGEKEERIPRREMSGLEQDARNQWEANSGLPTRWVLSREGTVVLCCHLEGAESTAAMSQVSPWPAPHPFLFSPAKEPHCSSSSQEMGLEKTSLSNQRS